MATYLGKAPARLAIVTDDSVTSAKIVDNTVTSADILNASITGADLATDIAITTSGNISTTGDLTVDTNTLYVDSTNNRVGIGTASPDVTLDVQPSVANSGIKIRRHNASSQYIEISESDGSRHQILAAGDKELRILNQSTSNPTTFYTSSTERVRIDQSGNVGIGTTSPSVALDVVGAITATGNITGTLATAAQPNITSVGTLTSLTTTGNINLGDADYIYLGDSNDFYLYHQSGNSVIRNSTGDLYIQDDNGNIYIRAKTGEDSIRVIADGEVSLYHNNSKKFETIATGIQVNGVTEVYAFGEPPSTGMLQLQANSSSRQLRISPPTDAQNGFIDYRGGNLLFKDDGTEVARFQGITGGANFGIGTSTVPATAKLTVSDADNAFIYVEENTGNVGDTSGILFKTSASNPGFFKTGMILEDDGTTYARGKLHIVQNSTANDSNATVSDSVVTILNDGKVGIGTSSPTEKLEVYGTEASDGVEILLHNVGNDGVDTIPYTAIRSKLSFVRNGGEIRFGRDSTYGSASTADSNLQFYTAVDDVNTERMRITSSGYVGIGTTSPQQQVDISSTAPRIRFSDTSVTGLHHKIGSEANDFEISCDAGNDQADSHIGFKIDNTERMRITSSGYVGIGTSNPGYPLDVAGVIRTSTTSDYVLRVGSTDGYAGILLYDGNTTAQTYNQIVALGNELRFKTSDTYRVTINSSGNVGIGTSSPSSPLTVSGGTNSTVANISNNVSTTTSRSTMLLLQSGTTGSAGVGFGMSIGFNGERNDGSNQRYGTLSWEANTNSATALKSDFVVTSYAGHEVLRLKQTSVGSQNEMIAPDLLTTGTTSNRYPLYWVYNGTVGSIQPYTGSVREMKTNINDMGSVDWIHSLRPRSFKFRDFETNEDGSKTYLETTDNEPNTEYGLIAEEVNEVSGSDYILDKQIDKDGNEKLKGVLYHNLVPVLLKAVQEQKTKIDELEARITALENN